MKIYIEAKSKAEINRWIKAGEKPRGYNYSMFGGGGWYYLTDCPSGTLVATYTKTDPSGNPVSRYYGTWNAEKKVLM